MKGKFYASGDLKQLESTLKEHEPYAVLVVSTTGIDKENEFEGHFPTRVVMKQFEFDDETKSYQSGFTFDKLVQAPQEAIQEALKNESSYDVFANGGIDKEAYLRGENVLPVAEFQKEFQTAISAVQESNATLIINNQTHAFHFMDKIQSADTLREIREQGKTLDQVNLTRAYFRKHDVQGQATLEALRNYRMSSPKSSFLATADKATLKDLSGMTKDAFMEAHPDISESSYDVTKKDFDRKSAKIIGGDQRIQVISNFITEYGREEKILENEYLTSMRESDAAKTRQWSERGKEKYRESNVDEKFQTLINKHVINPEKILAGDSQFHKLIDAIEHGENKGIMMIHTATTGFERKGNRTDTGFPIQFATAVYKRGEEGKIDMSHKAATTMLIQAPARSMANAEENIRTGKYDTFAESGINIDDYKAGKDVLSQSEAQERIHKVFQMFPPEDYTIVMFSKDFAQRSLQHLGNFSVINEPSIDATQAIKEYAYLASHDEAYHGDVALFDMNKMQAFGLNDVAESRGADAPKSAISKCLLMGQLLDEAEQQQIELFHPQDKEQTPKESDIPQQKEPATENVKESPAQKSSPVQKAPKEQPASVTPQEVADAEAAIRKEFENAASEKAQQETGKVRRYRRGEQQEGNRRTITREPSESHQKPSPAPRQTMQAENLAKTNEALNGVVASLSEALSKQTQSMIQMQSELMRTNQQLMETNQRLVSALEKQNEILQSLTGERSVSREQNPVEKIESLKEEISEMSENFPRSAAAYMTSANKALTTAQHEYEKNERNLEVADRSAS